jgi:dolichyl-phosphate-mannose-protein mannosyltransferase
MQLNFPIVPDDVPMEHEKRLTFIEKFINIHKTMFTVTAESIGTSAFETKPSTWPIIKYVMVYWMSSDLQIIYMGNPSVYFTTTVSVLACLGIYGILVLRDKRHYKDTLFGLRNYYQNSAGFFMTAWSITYFMNFFVEKQMFSSDYQPSLYFAALVMGVVADFLVRPVPLGVQVSLMIAVGTVFAYAYRIYAPITYGQPWTYSGCKEASLRYTWDMRCGSYMATTATFAERQPEEEQVTLVDDSTQQAVFETPEALQNDIVDDVQQQIQKEDTIVEEDEREYQYNEEYDDDEYYNEEEEEEEEEEDEIEPTEPAPVVEYAPEYVNGSEVIYPDEEDEDDWPKTIYGFGEDPELEEFDEPNPDYDPKAIRPIPITRS